MRPPSTASRWRWPKRIAWQRWFPLLGGLSLRSNATLAADLVAGAITAIVLVPQAVAFAALAGLPAQAGLAAAIVAPIVYALVGTSRVLAVGPVSVAAIMVADALAHAPRNVDVVAYSAMLALVAGVFLLLLAALRLGVIARALSHAALAGFTQAAAIVIILSQVPALLGNERWLRDAARPDWATAVIGVGAIALLWTLPSIVSRLARRLRGLAQVRAQMLAKATPLLVLMLASATAFGLAGSFGAAIKLVGAVPSSLPTITLPPYTAFDVTGLIMPAALIALVGYVGSIAIARAFASSDLTIRSNRELFALGLANVIGGASGAMPAAGGFSRTVVNADAGARTQLASIVAALLVALIVVIGSSWLALIPKTALAAIVLVAVARLIRPSVWKTMWRHSPSDAAVMAITFAAVLGLGFEWGLLCGAIATSVRALPIRRGVDRSLRCGLRLDGRRSGQKPEGSRDHAHRLRSAARLGLRGRAQARASLESR